VRDEKRALAPAKPSSLCRDRARGRRYWPVWTVMTSLEACHGGVERAVELEELSKGWNFDEADRAATEERRAQHVLWLPASLASDQAQQPRAKLGARQQRFAYR
jgi:hypothetical protein